MLEHPYFAFIDESGTLANDPNQPIFALGMLLIQDTSCLHQKLYDIKSQAVAATDGKATQFEFKFKRITKNNFRFYIKMIDLCLSFPQIRICVFVLDKTNPQIQPGNYFQSTWDAYISYAKLVIKKNLKHGESAIVLADYITKPSDNPKFFEPEITSLSRVANTTLLESDSSLFIQMIDVLTGSVVYHFRHKRINGLRVNKSKMKVANHLMRKFDRKTLAEKFTVYKPVYFSVWEFKP